MIIKEFYRENENGEKLYRTYSDLNVQIRQIETGNIYDEAIDLEDKNYTYEETEYPIEIVEDQMIQDDIPIEYFE